MKKLNDVCRQLNQLKISDVIAMIRKRSHSVIKRDDT